MTISVGSDWERVELVIEMISGAREE